MRKESTVRVPRLVLIGLVLLIASLALSSCGQSPSAQAGMAQTTTLAQESDLSPIALISEPQSGSFTRLPSLSASVDLPKAGSVMVYKVVRPTVDASAVRTMASDLGIEGDDVGEDEGYLFLRGAAGTLSVDKTSGAFFYDTPQLEGNGQPLKDVREDSYYRAEAEKFLKEKGWLPESAVYAGVAKELMMATDKEGKETTSPLTIEVLFHSKDLGDLRWAGIGPKISVFFGEGAQLTGVSVYWPKVEPYKEYPTISGEEAMKNIVAGKGSIVEADQADGEAIVQEAELVYWCDPVGYPQEFVAPYYCMKGTTGKSGSFTAYTRALPEGLVSETSPPSPQHPVTTTPREDE